jgi:4-diphosphocytidyl-2-C-methyl-D-erythritol kinase
MKTLVIEAPAKINLFLDVKGKRNDGYHELESIMHQINLVDRINIQVDDGITVKSSSPDIPDDEDNLAYQAARLILEKYGQGEGAAIFIEKNIPVGAGLAGGSTDAAAVLKGLNILYNYNVAGEELAQLAAQIGSDVPFCLQGHPLVSINDGGSSDREQTVLGASCLAKGRGEILSPLPHRIIPYMVLVKPEFQLSTAEVYKNFKLELLKSSPDIQAFIKAWQLYDIGAISKSCENVLETVSCVLKPEIMSIKEELEAMGALKAFMSGSGPAVIGIFESFQAAQRARKKRCFHKSFVSVKH